MNFNTEGCSYLFQNEFFSVFQLYHEMYIIAQQSASEILKDNQNQKYNEEGLLGLYFLLQGLFIC